MGFRSVMPKMDNILTVVGVVSKPNLRAFDERSGHDSLEINSLISLQLTFFVNIYVNN